MQPWHSRVSDDVIGELRMLETDTARDAKVGALVGVYKGLHLLFADDMADRWPSLDNRGPLFARQSPIASMIRGGIPQMLDVRRYVDAVRGGL